MRSTSQRVISHKDEAYKWRRMMLGENMYNGAYYYSQELTDNIIPSIKTDRSWITINYREGCDHSILIVHDNVMFEQTYDFMQRYDDVIYVVSLPDMIERAEKFGRVIYLPMSVDVEYVRTFRRKKDRDTAFCGRAEWMQMSSDSIPNTADVISGLPRTRFLQEMARYRNVYAVCRVAIEAKILGCNVLPTHPRFPNPDIFEVIDNSEAAMMLQTELDKIDR